MHPSSVYLPGSFIYFLNDCVDFIFVLSTCNSFK